MKKITVEITDREFENLKFIAEEHGANPKQIVQGFLDDLLYTQNSGGSDERELASDWLSRQTYRW